MSFVSKITSSKPFCQSCEDFADLYAGRCLGCDTILDATAHADACGIADAPEFDPMSETPGMAYFYRSQFA